jgi:hydrogenase maturation factor
LIASGALLAVVAFDAKEKALSALRSVGITARWIGGMYEDPEEIRILDGCLTIPLPTFPVDEFARLLAESVRKP